MARILTAILALLLLCGGAAFADDAAAPKGMVLLTVGGKIGNANRGPLDPQKDSLLAIQKVKFEHAFAFDRDMLLGLKQGTVTAETRELGTATFKGPLLSEVLGKIEAAKLKLTFVAVNGYTGWLMPEDVDRSDFILALEADGKPLGLGQQGPVWLINTRAKGEKASEDHRGHWVWSLFYIHVGE
jgi:hypothetical protein